MLLERVVKLEFLDEGHSRIEVQDVPVQNAVVVPKGTLTVQVLGVGEREAR